MPPTQHPASQPGGRGSSPRAQADVRGRRGLSEHLEELLPQTPRVLPGGLVQPALSGLGGGRGGDAGPPLQEQRAPAPADPNGGLRAGGGGAPGPRGRPHPPQEQWRGLCVRLLRPWPKMPSSWACPVAWATAFLPRPWGTAKTLLQKGQHPPQLRIHVRTLCGTAIHGLDVPEQGGASSRKKGAGAGRGPRPPSTALSPPPSLMPSGGLRFPGACRPVEELSAAWEDRWRTGPGQRGTQRDVSPLHRL